MRLVKKQGYSLFDIETFIRENDIKSKTPEIILWNEKEVLIIEAKQSVPRKAYDSVPSELGEQARKYGYELVSKLDLYCDELREKYTSALVFLRPDVINHFLDKAKGNGGYGIEEQQCIRRINLNKADNVCLLFVLKGIPLDKLPPLQHELDEKIIGKIREWQPNCKIKVMNEELAIKYGFIAPPACEDI